MTNRTKAVVEAENAQLREENAALRDLIKAVHECTDLPEPAEGGWDEYSGVKRRRFIHIQVWLMNQHEAGVKELRQCAGLFRERSAPVTYTAAAGQAEPSGSGIAS